MPRIPIRYDEGEIKAFLASILHGEHFGNVQTNFVVHLHKPKKPFAQDRTGTFTVADAAVGKKFLLLYGDGSRPAYLNNQIPIYFRKSLRPPQPEIIELISRIPWVDPAEERRQGQINKTLSSSSVTLSAVQFCWGCRDGVYSIEAESTKRAKIRFDPERRELHVIVQADGFQQDLIAIRYNSICSISRHFSTFDSKYVTFLELENSPMFLRERLEPDPDTSTLAGMIALLAMENGPMYTRMSTFPPLNNPRAMPFTSGNLRLVFTSREGCDTFLSLLKAAGIPHGHTFEIPVERRHLFSLNLLNAIDRHLPTFPWCIAFQLASLLHNMTLDASELLDLIPQVKELWRIKDEIYVAKLLREFQNSASAFSFDDGEDQTSISSYFSSFNRAFEPDAPPVPFPGDGSYFQSLRVTLTPTRMFLEGPFPERSNRIIRRYDERDHESFLRVSFREENGLKYRFDRGVDGAAFSVRHVGQYLKNGLPIAGHLFNFLAYSQSALKEHSVWFVKPFYDSLRRGEVVYAGSIIESLGQFDNLAYDPELMRCPARYAARISQAFTATDGAKVAVRKIVQLNDIKTADGKYVFTDGVGTLSKDLARAIWERVKRRGRLSDFPHAYQIRFEGSKGMLSIDHTLSGTHTIGLRPSMIKFETQIGIAGEREIEIARAFDRPTPYYLNRPLIMLLEGLGIKYEVFKHFQDRAIRATQDASKSLSEAARLLETHGLGTSFRLPSIMRNIVTRLGVDSIDDDPFYTNLLKVAVYDVLRDLKHHARIPIPDAWTLVGVADIHGYLKEREVFACIKQDGKDAIYLDGPVLVSRSPCIHPGDVQLAIAIGKPPEGSCFVDEPLCNTLVFSIRGTRPLPSCLGGGDLDGDVYNIIPLEKHPEFSHIQTYQPAEYAPAPRKVLHRNSTMEDVADFVVEYINSDAVGIIATNWLIIADQSRDHIFDKDCIKLAQLHSDAVDYPKSGQAVHIRTIPRLKMQERPDWSAPETVQPGTKGYYRSQRAVGKLFNDVELDDIPSGSKRHRRRPKRSSTSRKSRTTVHDNAVATINSTLFELVQDLVEDVVDTEGPWEKSMVEDVRRIFRHYSTDLAGIAANYNLSNRIEMLSEEEVTVGTITQKTSQPRARTEQMDKVREHTDTLVKRVRLEIEGDENRTLEDYLGYAWLSWRLSFEETDGGNFGAKSFGWVALGAIFEALKQFEHDTLELRSGRATMG